MATTTAAAASGDEHGDRHPWTLGQNIVRLRRSAGLTQRQISEALGVTRPTVSRWETGLCMPERKHLVGLALLLKVRPDQLFERPKRKTR